MMEKQAVDSGTNLEWYKANKAVDECANQERGNETYPDDDEWIEALTTRLNII